MNADPDGELELQVPKITSKPNSELQQITCVSANDTCQLSSILRSRSTVRVSIRTKWRWLKLNSLSFSRLTSIIEKGFFIIIVTSAGCGNISFEKSMRSKCIEVIVPPFSTHISKRKETNIVRGVLLCFVLLKFYT